MDRYILRRHLLRVMTELEPAPVDLAMVCAAPIVRLATMPRDDIADALRGLAEHGYCRDLRPGRDPLYRITPAGRDQLRQECDLDEYVWGEFASKFAPGSTP